MKIMPDIPSLATLLAPVSAIAEQAGAEILRVKRGGLHARKKADRSPVTEADMAANRVIAEGLQRLAPEIMLISEEDTVPASYAPARPFWLVDPLDGTRSFLRGEPTYCVNIALIIDRRPVLGVIHIPEERATYAGAEGLGCTRTKDSGPPVALGGEIEAREVRALISHRQVSERMQAWLDAHGIRHVGAAPSAVKFCRVAEGEYDVYPRYGPTYEWDTAAGQALVEAAGGRMLTHGGTPFLYGKAGFRNEGFVAWRVWPRA